LRSILLVATASLLATDGSQGGRALTQLYLWLLHLTSAGMAQGDPWFYSFFFYSFFFSHMKDCVEGDFKITMAFNMSIKKGARMEKDKTLFNTGSLY